jgi:predicted CxxxxCH...CXXCH cytochrome family protein
VNRGTYATPVRCDQCHLYATHQYDQTGNADINFGDIATKDGTLPIWNRGAGTCSATYCHGATLVDRNGDPTGSATTPSWITSQTVSCASCHAAPPTMAQTGHPTNATCATCHGTGYSAVAVAKPSHVNGVLNAPASQCAKCHGDLAAGTVDLANNLASAAPGGGNAPTSYDVAGNQAATVAGVGAHRAHGAGALGSVIGCASCHALPATNDDRTHATGTSGVGGQGSRATVALGAVADGTSMGSSVSAAYTGSNSAGGGTIGGSCATYCHGNFGWYNPDTLAFDYGYGKPGTLSWTSTTDLTCNSCHGTGTGALATHPGGFHQVDDACGSCHDGYSRSTVNAANHINGRADYTPRAAAQTCTGCHGDAARAWVADSVTMDPIASGLLGKASPPKDGNGQWTGTFGVGAHQAHVNPPNDGTAYVKPIACTTCHSGQVPPSIDPSATHRNSTPNTAFSGLAAGTTYASHNCTTYCHGSLPISWGTGTPSKLACDACHGNPPAEPHVQSANCGTSGCHAGYGAVAPVTTVNLADHVDGAVDVDTGNQTCSTCHGTTGRNTLIGGAAGTADAKLAAAPPKDTATLSSSNRVGPHLAHVYPDPAQSIGQVYPAFGCAECHTSAVATYTNAHPNVTRNVSFADATGADLAGYTPTLTPGSPYGCTTYCHGDSLAAGQQGTVGTWAWDTVTLATCSSCHGTAPNDPEHTSVSKSAAATACNPCHNTTVDATGKIVFSGNTTLHINGTFNTGGVTCHSCHGDTNSDAPPPVANSANANGAGTHRSHVQATQMTTRSAGYACTECHPAVTANDWVHANGTPDTQWAAGDLSPNNVWTDGTSTCATSYCHGDSTETPTGATVAQTTWGGAAKQPIWTNALDTYRACTACHASPPTLGATNPHPPNNTCDDCHPNGATTTAITAASAAAGAHVNKTVDVDRTGCTSCHGDFTQNALAGGGNPVGAAPGYFNVSVLGRDASGSTSSTRVGAHRQHLQGTRLNPAVRASCAVCHAVPATGNTAHATGVGTSTARATVTITGTLATGGGTYTPSFASGSCNATYCHSPYVGQANYAGPTPSPSWSAGASGASCGACHLAPPTSAGHGSVTADSNCSTCHGANYNCVPSNSAACALGATHMDGTKDTVSGCASCHGASARTTQDALAWGGGETGTYLSSSPPIPSSGRSANETGPHLGHVQPNPAQAQGQMIPPVLCTECHPAIASYDGSNHLTNLANDVAFTAAIRSGLNSANPTWANGDDAGVTPGSCAANYCHGTTLPVAARGTVTAGAGWKWDATTVATCGSCHGAKPGTPWHTSATNAVTGCTTCHSATVDASGKILSAVNGSFGTQHIDGTVDASTTCRSCHGDATSDAPPPVANAANTNGAGAHRNHVVAASMTTRSAAYTCVQCHGTGYQTYTATHANGPAAAVDMSFASGDAAGTAWTDGASNNVSTCGTSYCHGSGGATTVPIYKAGATTGLTSKAQSAWGGAATVPVWTTVDGTYKACTACHKNPPDLSASNPHPPNATCNDCHPAGATASAITAASAAAANHVNKRVDVTRTGCTMCHGDFTADAVAGGGNPTQSAPGYNGTGEDVGGATTGARVGAHQAHLQDTVLRPTALACNECHAVPATGNTAHATGTGGSTGARALVDMQANGVAAEYGGAVPAYASGTCSDVYCHGSKLSSGGASKNPTWTGATYTCASCHTDGTGHYGTGCGTCHGVALVAYYGTQTITNNTVHMNGSINLRDDVTCVSCHNVAQPSVTPTVRAVVGVDFQGRSHHVGGNTTTTEVVTQWDCVVCHAEGKPNVSPSPTKVDVTSFHRNGTINLVNADTANYTTFTNGGSLGTAGTDYWTFPKSNNMNTTASGPRMLANLSSTDRGNLDKFCLKCHDSNGATSTFNMNPAETTFRSAGQTAGAGTNASMLPFNINAQRRSPTDFAVRTGATFDPDGAGALGNTAFGYVADVRTQFDPTGSFPGDTTTRTWTKFSYHALMEFGVSRYAATTGGITATRWPATAACRDATGAAVACNDTRLMYCSDCHRSDWNSHGTRATDGADYLLKCRVGGTSTACTADYTDIRGTAPNSTSTGSGVCFRCHNVASYGSSGHAPGTSCIVEPTTWNTQAGRDPVASGRNAALFGLSCFNCHGGYTYGGIHGVGSTAVDGTTREGQTSGNFRVTRAGTQTRKGWRFINGGSQPFYDQETANTTSDTGSVGTATTGDNNQWAGTRAASCYTLATDNSFGGCTQHNPAATTASQLQTRTLNY